MSYFKINKNNHGSHHYVAKCIIGPAVTCPESYGMGGAAFSRNRCWVEMRDLNALPLYPEHEHFTMELMAKELK